MLPQTLHLIPVFKLFLPIGIGSLVNEMRQISLAQSMALPLLLGPGLRAALVLITHCVHLPCTPGFILCSDENIQPQGLLNKPWTIEKLLDLAKEVGHRTQEVCQLDHGLSLDLEMIPHRQIPGELSHCCRSCSWVISVVIADENITAACLFYTHSLFQGLIWDEENTDCNCSAGKIVTKE